MKRKWIFDNDGVLYNDQYIQQQFTQLFEKYMAKELDIPVGDIKALTINLKNKYATEFSIIAFIREFDLSFSEIVRNTYLKLDLSTLRQNSQKLNILRSLVGKKIVFTANPAIFARYVLRYIKLFDCFDQVIGIEETGFIPKSNKQAYQIVERLTQSSAKEIYFCDDSIVNLNVAQQMGWTTIWYCPKNISSCNHIVVQNFEELLNL